MNVFLRTLGLALAFGSASCALGAVEVYTIDPARSSVTFSIRNFFRNVPGKFGRFSGTIHVEAADVTQSSAEAVIEVASIDTGNQKRDTHLRSADFFDVAPFPVIRFKSTAWKSTGERTVDITGDLTMKDVTKQVVLKVSWSGITAGTAENQRLRYDAKTTINKKEFNVKDPPLLGAALGDEVAVTLRIEAKKAPSE